MEYSKNLKKLLSLTYFESTLPVYSAITNDNKYNGFYWRFTVLLFSKVSKDNLILTTTFSRSESSF